MRRNLREILGAPLTRPVVQSDSGWFNPGEFLVPKVHHRGFPYELRHQDLKLSFRPQSDVRIGIASGLWLGDPDIDAMERIINRPVISHIADLMRHGVALSRDCLSPVNSQNTGYLSCVAPLMMVLTGVGRFDDVWGSYMAQRVLVDSPYRVHFGPPIVRQERNPQDPWNNLRDELFGMAWCRDVEKVLSA